MAKPKNKRGFRPITVKEMTFHWRLSGVLDIRPDQHQANVLKVDFGWYDVFQYFSDPENIPPPFEPKIVTSKFVSECILFALQNGWNTDLSHNETKLKYSLGKYEVI